MGFKDYISKHHYLCVFILIVFIKVFLWTFCFAVSHIYPLSPMKYFVGFHHFETEPRITEGKVDFFSLWIYSDAEWYVSIADAGYPNEEGIDRARLNKETKTGAPYNIPEGYPLKRNYKYTEWDVDTKYAFFPLYPLCISFFHLFLPLRIAAFVATNVISMGAFFMLYSLIFLYFKDKKLALKSLLLLVFYPFSAFYQAYFTEGLFLLLSVLSFYFLKKKMIFLSMLSGILLCLTKAMGVFIVIPLLLLAIKDDNWETENTQNTGKGENTKNTGKKEKNKKKSDTKKELKISWGKCFIISLSTLGIIPFAVLNYINTGYWNYFSLVLQKWSYKNTSFIQNILNNILVTGLNFFNLKLLYFHESQIDYLIMLSFAVFLIISYRKIPTELWSFSLIIWIVPLISKDLMSFSRYMSVSFPAFLYLAMILKKDSIFYFILSIFFIFSLLIHGLMINWYWVG